MKLPDGLRLDVERALTRAGGSGASMRESRELSGGCINRGARLETEGGEHFFLKWNPGSDPEMFVAEADGLRALAGAEGVRVPEVMASGGGGDVPPWLLLEYVPPGRHDERAEQRLGRGLAALHGRDRDHSFGWHRDNWIGSLPQDNTPSDRWGPFWRDRRLAPQLERARAEGSLHDPVFDRLLERVPDILAEVTRAGLLHGDLWRGNAYTSTAGEPVLIDPAVYRGHGEVDLAMTELFGGFSEGFYDAYREAHPVPDAYASHRRDLYQLHYLLVHVSLFGAGYVAASRRAAERVLAAWG